MLLDSLRPLVPYLKKHRRSYILGGISVLMMNAIWVLFPLVIGRAIDSLKDADVSGQTLRTISKLAALILAVAVSKGIFQFLTRWIVIGTNFSGSWVSPMRFMQLVMISGTSYVRQ